MPEIARTRITRDRTDGPAETSCHWRRSSPRLRCARPPPGSDGPRMTTAAWSVKKALLPDPAGDLADQSELRLLLPSRHRLRDLTRREAALRAQRQPLERNVRRRFLDSGDEVVGAFERPVL